MSLVCPGTITGFGVTDTTTLCVAPTQLGAAVAVGVTSNVTDPAAPDVLVRAAAPVNVADRFPDPVWLSTAPPIVPVMLVTFQLNVLAIVDVKTNGGALPLQAVVVDADVIVGLLLTLML